MKELENAPFALIGVNSDGLERAHRAVAENELNWRSFQNKPEGAAFAIADVWSVRGWPTIVVIDETFTIRYRGHSGPAAEAMAKELVAKLQAKRQG